MHICAEQAACIDNEGSFSCSCDMGFSGDGMTCTGKHALQKIEGLFYSCVVTSSSYFLINTIHD